MTVRVKGSGVPPTPAAGYTTIFIDENDKNTKQIDDAGVVKDLSGSSSAVVATDQEYFDKDATKVATCAQISVDNRIQNYSVKGNTGAISQVLTPGSAYNFLTTMLNANESVSGIKPDFFDKNDQPQATYLDEANNRFIYPSNLYTFNTSYTPYNIRVITTIDHPAVGSNQVTSIIIRLRRYIDNSIVSEKNFDLSNKTAANGFIFTLEFLTFVGGETDPYVLDGMYIDVLNSADSSTNFTVVQCDIRKFKF